MAEPINLKVTATDEASKTLDQVKAKGDALAKERVTVDVGATDEATAELTAVEGEVGSLDGTSATVSIDGDDQASDDVARVDDELSSIDGNSATVTVEGDDSGAIDAVDEAQSALDDFDGSSATATIDGDDSGLQTAVGDAQGALDDFDGSTATGSISVDDEASQTIEDVQGSLDDLNGTDAIPTISTDEAVAAVNRLTASVSAHQNAIVADKAWIEAWNGAIEIGMSDAEAEAAADNAAAGAIQRRTAATQGATAAVVANTSASGASVPINTSAAGAIDAVEGSSVRSARSLSRMGAATGGATKEAAQMANAFFGLQQILDQVFGSSKLGSSLSASLGELAGPALAAAAGVAALNVVAKAAKDVFGPDLSGPITRYGAAAQSAAGPTGELSQRLLEQAIAAKNSGNLWDDLQRGLTNTVGALKDEISDSKTGAAAIELFNKTLKDSPGLAREMAITLQELADAGKVSWEATDTATQKLIEHEQAAAISSQANKNLAADQKIVNQATAEGIDTTRRAGEAYGSYIFRLGDAVKAHEDVANASGNAATAADNLIKSLQAESTAYADEAKSAQAAADAMQAQADAARSAADDTFAAQKSADTYAQALDDLDGKVKKIQGSNEDAATKQREINQLYRDVATDAGNAADAQVKLSDDQAKANGITQSSTQRIDEWNHSMLEQATQAGPQARQAVIDYIGQVNQIPPDKLTAIKAAIDAGDLTTANQLLADASKTRTADINADAHTSDAEQALDNAARNRTAIINATIVADVNKFINSLPAFLRNGLSANNAMSGTPYSEEGIYRVGEAGPENVYLPRGSRVDTAGVTAMTARSGGDTIVNYAITINAPPLVSPADVGQAAVSAIKAFEARSGPGWRSTRGRAA